MILVDAHVHIYDCFDLEKFFNAAYSNFKSAAERYGQGDDFTGILLLAETSSNNWFKHLSNDAYGSSLTGGRETQNWTFHRTDETGSLYARFDSNLGLFLIAGRQLVTREGLEVLSLATTESFEEGIPIKELIEKVQERGAIPVIPWGFGKWMGQRGTILNQLLEKTTDFGFFLGDSRNRPFFMPYPSQFKLAQIKNVRNLPGSDPLPFRSEQIRPGCFGFSISDQLDKSNPMAQLKKMFANKRIEFNIFGEPIGAYDFFKKQLLLQLNRCKGKISV